MSLLTPVDRCSENICVLSVIIAELKLGSVERHIFSTHLVERADDDGSKHSPGLALA